MATPSKRVILREVIKLRQELFPDLMSDLFIDDFIAKLKEQVLEDYLADTHPRKKKVASA